MHKKTKNFNVITNAKTKKSAAVLAFGFFKALMFYTS